MLNKYNTIQHNTEELNLQQNTVMSALLATNLHNSKHYSTV